ISPDSPARKRESRVARVLVDSLDPRFPRGRREKHLLARLPRRRPQGLHRGRHHPRRRRPSDDLRRLHASADMRAAYDALDERAKTEIEDLVCEHSLIYSREAIGFTDLT